MSVFWVIAALMSCLRADTFGKRGSFMCSLVLLSSCIWVFGPAAAASVKPAGQFDGSVTRLAEGGELAQQELIALNLLAIRYAKGQGVKQNPRLAMKFFLRSAIQGYAPAMANIGTLYELGATKHSDFQRAYAWIRTALSFGVPEEDHDETVMKLWMIAARLGPDRIESAERLADVIAARIVETCKCSPGQKPNWV